MKFNYEMNIVSFAQRCKFRLRETQENRNGSFSGGERDKNFVSLGNNFMKI